MTTEPLAGCAIALSADDLSAWRDGAVDRATDVRLAEHVSGCGACRARLVAYEAIAQALRAIPTPEPASGFGRNPRLRAVTTQAPQRRSAGRRRRALGGLGAVAAVALLALAFTQVVGRLGVHSPSASATQAPTALATATVAATDTPTKPTLPAFQTVSAATAWGNTGLVAHIASTQIDANTNFIPSALLPDGSALVGQIYHATNNTSQPALWNIATGKVTLLNAPSESPMYDIMTDGRYIILKGGNDLFVYDLTAGAVVRHVMVSADAAPALFDHGIYVQQYLGGGIFTINVATGQQSDFPSAAVVTQHARLLAFSWPYIIYMPEPTATTLPDALAVRDLATGQDADLAPLAPLLPGLMLRLKDNQNLGVAVTNGALFVVTAPSPDVNQLYELDNFMSAAPTLRPIARVESQFTDRIMLWGANVRVVGMNVGAPPTAYDRALGKAVQFSMLGQGTEVTGHFVVAMGPLNGHEFDPYEVIIYDTNKLPGG